MTESKTSVLSVTNYGPLAVVLVRVTTGGRSKVVAQFQKTCGPDENPTHFGLEDLPALAMLCRNISEQLITVQEPEEKNG